MHSSAKNLIVDSVFLQILFTYARNSSGLSTLPCGTPDVTLTSSDNCPPTLSVYGFTPRPLYLWERAPGTHSVGVCVGPRTGLERKKGCLYRSSSPYPVTILTALSRLWVQGLPMKTVATNGDCQLLNSERTFH
jgi:hypothetical protein